MASLRNGSSNDSTKKVNFTLAVDPTDLKLCNSCGRLCCSPSRIKKHSCIPKITSDIPPKAPLTRTNTDASKMSATSSSTSPRAVGQVASPAIRPASSRKDNLMQASEQSRQACVVCNRPFSLDRIYIHEAMCKKVADHRRRQNRGARPRIREPSRSTPAKPVPRKADWRRKHEDFINAIHAARAIKVHVAKGGKISDLPPPPPMDTSDYIQCPTCQRKFNAAAAERHLPFCAKQARIMPKRASPDAGNKRVPLRAQSACRR